jgi:hypothetical protein
MIEESRRLASYGRYGDNSLVHVSNRELAGLESLTGRRFTKNPHTGLPEAFGFEDLLPAIAGAIATVATGGAAAPLVGALAAGATGAGVGAAKGENMNTALMHGLISGVGSYAGAGALSGVADAAIPAAIPAATSAGSEVLAQAPTDLAVASPGFTGVESAPGITSTPTEAMQPDTSLLDARAGGYQTMPGPPQAQAPLANFGSPSTLDNATTRLGNVVNQPTAALDKLGSNLTTLDGLKGAGILAGTTYYGSTLAPQKKPALPGTTPWNYDSRIPQSTRPVTMPGPDYRPGFSPEARYFADGGPVSVADNTPPPSVAGIGSISNPRVMPYVAPMEPAAMPSAGPNVASQGAPNYSWKYDPNHPIGIVPSRQNLTPAPMPASAITPIQTAQTNRPGFGPEQNYLLNNNPSSYYKPPAPEAPPSIQADIEGNSGGGGDGGGGGGMARGGLASLSKTPHGVTANIVNEAKAAMVGEHPNPKQALQRFRETFGDSALRALSESFAEGGRIRGAGGGLDDLVPGTIEGRQRVRLADGEFVVSADVVSALGDGSTDQGVRKLQEMMNRVRREKTGKTKQPGPISHKALPA